MWNSSSSVVRFEMSGFYAEWLLLTWVGCSGAEYESSDHECWKGWRSSKVRQMDREREWKRHTTLTWMSVLNREQLIDLSHTPGYIPYRCLRFKPRVRGARTIPLSGRVFLCRCKHSHVCWRISCTYLLREECQTQGYWLITNDRLVITLFTATQ